MNKVVFLLAFSFLSPLFAQDGNKLIEEKLCFFCHAISASEMRIGPSFQMVATRYQNASPQVKKALAAKIIRGGSGNWGAIPMNSNPQVSPEEAQQIVDWILQQKPEK